MKHQVILYMEVLDHIVVLNAVLLMDNILILEQMDINTVKVNLFIFFFEEKLKPINLQFKGCISNCL